MNPLVRAMLPAVFAAALAPGAEAGRLPWLAQVERGEYRARDAGDGADLWRHEWTVEREVRGEETVLRVRQQGHGRRGRPAPTAWVGDMRVALRSDGYRLSSRREIRDASGTLLETEERELDSTAGTGRIAVVDPSTGRTSLRRLRVARDAIDLEMLPVELRRLPALGARRIRFELVTDDGRTVGMEAAIVGQEPVEVSAGTFVCHRIDLRIAGVLGAVAGLFLPRFSMWHTVAPPHFWVKYRGPAGGVGSPEILRELIRFERSGK